MTFIVKPEKGGVTVPRETTGIKLTAEQTGVSVEVENMGFDATKLNTGGSQADSYWMWGSGEWILLGDGEEIEL